ncbi:hypothetical protein ACQ94Q_24500, partial [Escherichia coli]
TVCVVGKIRDLILQLSKSSIYSTKPLKAFCSVFFKECFASGKYEYEAYLSERQHAIRNGY